MFRWFWYLAEDLSEQPVIIKLFLAWGWLSVLLMAIGIFDTLT